MRRSKDCEKASGGFLGYLFRVSLQREGRSQMSCHAELPPSAFCFWEASWDGKAKSRRVDETRQQGISGGVELEQLTVFKSKDEE